MKFYIKSFLLILIVFAGLTSCKKSGSELEYGYSKVYMPQAINNSGGVNNNLPVPSGTDTSTYNYILDHVNKRVNVILGVSLSGPQKGAYSVNISTNTDTVNQMIANGTLDNTTQLMPSSMYTLPTNVSVASSTGGNTFYLSMSFDSLMESQYAGKKLALAVKISNPTQYTLDTALATTIVIVDVNTLITSIRDVTSKYLANVGPNFNGTYGPGNNRFGKLGSPWITNAAGLNKGSGTAMYGGWEHGSWEPAAVICWETWDNTPVTDGKIYQVTSSALPAGTYTINYNYYSELQTNSSVYCIVAADSSGIPSLSNLSSALGSSELYNGAIIGTTNPNVTETKSFNFTLTAPQVVSLGFLGNMVGGNPNPGNYFKVFYIQLLKNL